MTNSIYIPASCEGEVCFCGKPAIRKLGEEIFSDDPIPNRHNLTSYVCGEHFAMVLGPVAAKSVGVEPQTEKSLEYPYITIPFIIALILVFAGLAVMFLVAVFQMADWLPSISHEGTIYSGASSVPIYGMWVARIILVTWPILTIIAIFEERKSREVG